LLSRKVFVTRDEILTGEYYGRGPQKSYTSMIASAIYTRTIGKLWGSTQFEGATDDNQEIISVDYLKRKGESIINWATSINKEIFSEK
jgi:hypothetical protein